jgi:predicted dehydrogenase
LEVKVGVIGLGYWGPNLVRNFNAAGDSKVITCCDLQPERCRKISVQYPNIKFSQNERDVIENPDVDAVVIATPVKTHYGLVKAALRAKKHVLVTKPITDNLHQAKELADLADEMQLVLQVDHTFIYHPAVEKLKDIVSRGELGELYYFDSVRINLGLFQSDVSVLWDLAPHDISIMEYLIDRQVEWVQAIGASHAGHKSESMAYITVQFAGNVLGHCHVNWLAPMKTRLVMLGGSRRLAVYDDNLVTEKIKIYDKGITRSSIEGLYDALVQYRNGDMYAPAIENKEALEREVKHFNHCVQQKSSPITDGRAGVRVVSILSAAQESIRNGGKQVRPQYSISKQSGKHTTLRQRSRTT